MRRYPGMLRIPWLAAAVAWHVGLTACSGDGMGFDSHACDGSPVPGVWDVSLDYGDGRTAVQRWSISRDYCTLTIVADPADEFSPSTAYIQDPGFWANWSRTVGTCKYILDMTADVSFDSFTAPIAWRRIANGTGDCMPAQGQVMATAVRR